MLVATSKSAPFKPHPKGDPEMYFDEQKPFSAIGSGIFGGGLQQKSRTGSKHLCRKRRPRGS